MNALLIDSSCWIEIFTDGPLAKDCQEELKTSKTILVPTLVLYEVYRKVKMAFSDEDGLAATAFLSQYDVCPLSREVAISAADLSVEYRLGTADSLILAHARANSATLLTLDNDFRDLPGVRLVS